MKENNLFIGTCSWKYEDWIGIIYTADNKNYLEEYSKIYNSVEIDQWFWSLFPNSIVLPKIETAKEYANSVGDKFKFTIKVPNSITLTHHYKTNIENKNFLSPELMVKFIENVLPLENKIGALIMQFEYLNKQKMESLDKFIELLQTFFNKLPKNINYAVEIRNPNYVTKKYFEFLNSAKIGNVFIQGYYMPPIWETFFRFKDLLNTNVVIRLLGDDRNGIENITNGKWNSIVVNRDNEILRINEIIKSLKIKQVPIFLNINNHYEGCAPKTIEKIVNLL